MRDLPYVDFLMDEAKAETAIEERTRELYERRLNNVWSWALSQPEGRFLIWSILDHCHVFGSTYTGNAGSNFLEGERNVGLQILRGHIFPHGHHTLGQLIEEADHRFSELTSIAENQINGETDDRADD